MRRAKKAGIGFGILDTLFVVFVFAMGSVLGSAAAQESSHIAAIVNNEAITQLDVSHRTRLLFFNSGLADSEANRASLRRLARQQLIDDRLKLQEAERLNLSASEDEIDALMSNIESRNNLAAGGLVALLQTNGISLRHFREQLRAQLSWDRILHNRFFATGISEQEIAAYIEGFKARQNYQEFRLREIFLPFPSRALVAKTQKLARDILQRLWAGANFAALAQNFSDSHSARFGGDLGWVSANFLSPPVAKVAESLEEGEVSRLIESLSGITIIKLEARRSLNLQQIAAAIEEDNVRTILSNRKLELLNRENLYRLKADAFIEIR